MMGWMTPADKDPDAWFFNSSCHRRRCVCLRRPGLYRYVVAVQAAIERLPGRVEGAEKILQPS
jgi:hypothetical protein